MKFNKNLVIFLFISISLFISGFSSNLLKNLKKANDQQVNLAGAEIREIVFNNKSVKVRLDLNNIAEHLNTKPINCYQFSTANPKKDYPGNKVLKDINEKSLKEAMKSENAIEIIVKGGNNKLEDGANIDPTKNYYIIGVMWYPGEYHFVRLFKNGWFSKPSKVGSGNWVNREFKAPSEAMGNTLAKTSGNRVYKFLGFYLHPNNDVYINKLLQ
jgi:hypothetical protein